MLRRGRGGSLAIVMAFALLWVLPAIGRAEPPPRTGALAKVERWGYQLQDYDFKRLRLAPVDLLVIDQKEDGAADRPFNARELGLLKTQPEGGRRIVLAYLSIGEAESYRSYWKWYWGGNWFTNLLGYFLAPRWVGPENKEWGGNFAVRYWDPGWQEVILGSGGYLDQIIAAGFDGVYLDKVDSSIESIAKGRVSAKDDMRAFVRKIAEKGRAARPGFIVVPQNGEELLDDESYIQLIDGIAKEDLLYGEFKDKKPNPEDVIQRRAAELERARDKGKTVLAVEYLNDEEEIEQARERLEKLGFVPNFADRGLDTLRFGDLPAE
ncbi:MAG: MJ1477/TM1410 family putative glycoside hydrolase [Hyphomicrobiaceae bacterium]